MLNVYIVESDGNYNIDVTLAETTLFTFGYNASDYASLAAAVAAIGSTPATLYVNDSQAVTVDLTIPATLALNVIKPGLITISSGKVLTINGPFDAGLYQVFSGPGSVVFLNNSINKAYPQWWGGQADAATDQSSYIHQAINSNRPVKLTKGIWECNLTIANLSGASLQGEGILTVLHSFDGVNPVITINSTTAQTIGTILKRLYIDGEETAKGLYMTATTPYVVSHSVIENITFTRCTRSIDIYSGSSAEEVHANKFSNITISDIPAGTIGAYNYGIYQNYGVYNTWENIFITGCDDYVYAINSTGTSNTWIHITTDGEIKSSGQNATWLNVTVETLFATTPPSTESVFRNDGANSTIIGFTVIEVDHTKVENVMKVWSVNHFISKIRAYNTEKPDYSVIFEAGSSGTLIDVVGCTYTPISGNSETIRRNWVILNCGEANVERWATSTPQGGSDTWVAGDYVRNSAPSVGQPKGWICTVGGTPGTWVSEGNL